MRIVMGTVALVLAGRFAAAQPAAGAVDLRGGVAMGQMYLDESFADHTEAGGSSGLGVAAMADQREVLTFTSTVTGLPNEFASTIYATALRLFGALTTACSPTSSVASTSAAEGSAIRRAGRPEASDPDADRRPADVGCGDRRAAPAIGASVGVRLR